MKDPADKLVEFTGSSTTSIEDAIISTVYRAYKTIRDSCWFQVIETHGGAGEGREDQWQVTIRVGLTKEG
jgi:hypothetical protein